MKKVFGVVVVIVVICAVIGVFTDSKDDSVTNSANNNLYPVSSANIYAVPDKIPENMYRYVDCAVCDSTGRVICTNCKGEGYVIPYGDRILNCSTCNSTGKMRCGACSGNGYIAEINW